MSTGLMPPGIEREREGPKSRYRLLRTPISVLANSLDDGVQPKDTSLEPTMEESEISSPFRANAGERRHCRVPQPSFFLI